MLHLMCYYKEEIRFFDNFEMLNKVLRNLLYEECKGCDKQHTVL
jgi:hypothetical protein